MLKIFAQKILLLTIITSPKILLQDFFGGDGGPNGFILF